MSMSEIIKQMESLASHCSSMINPVELESIWREDVKALNMAVEKLDNEISGGSAAEIVRKVMEKENVNQIVLAERMGCVRQNVSDFLNRGKKSMRYDSFERMIVALGYEVIVRKKLEK